MVPRRGRKASTMKPLVTIAAFLALAAGGAGAAAPSRDLKSDMWVATDALGRQTLPWVDTPLRPGKTVGMFYFLWMGEHGAEGPYDITRLLAENPENPAYGPRHVYHLWGEPEAGYYFSSDPWVAQRNASMLADAGVDALIFDVTNGPTYRSNYRLVCRTLEAMRANGHKTPGIAFITWSQSPDVVRSLYDDLYATRSHSDLWFRWQGRPLMLGKRNEAMRDGSALPEGIREFFTWREAWFQPSGYRAGHHRWTWGSTSPQDFAWDVPGVAEQVSVSVATHPTGNVGRSHSGGQQPATDRYRLAPSTPFGLFFDEQWRRALELDPAFVFVTGWNEWQAMRFLVGPADADHPDRDAPISVMAGRPVQPGDSYFVDLYNQEFSRDIEPMRDGHTDNYYYQLVNYVRRFKGARRPEAPGPRKAIRLEGPFSQWDDVTPEYRDTIGDTLERDHPGWGGRRYVNRTGRNDITRAKVARDAKNITFYVETAAPLSPHTDADWMVLYLDTDQNPHTGRNGYDYAVNAGPVGEKTTTLSRYAGGKWRKMGQASYRKAGNRLMIQVPRAAIGQAGREVALDFHWADNAGSDGDVSRFFTAGDSAPNRRFNYRYGAATPGPVWEFRHEGFTNGWSGGPNVTRLCAEGSALAGNTSGGAGYVQAGRYPSIEASSNGWVVVRMSASAGKRATLHWASDRYPIHGNSRKITFPIRADGKPHTYVVDLHRNAGWTGWVHSLRLHPTDAAGEFRIERVWVRPHRP